LKSNGSMAWGINTKWQDRDSTFHPSPFDAVAGTLIA